jgi:hypothetical protein
MNKIAYQELGCIHDHLFTGSKSKLEPVSKSNLEPDSTRFPPCQGQVVPIPLTVIRKYGQEEIHHIKLSSGGVSRLDLQLRRLHQLGPDHTLNHQILKKHSCPSTVEISPIKYDCTCV